MKQIENPDPADDSEDKTPDSESPATETRKRSNWPLVALFLLILCGALAGAGYWGWLEFGKYQSSMNSRLDALQSRIDQNATRAQLNSALRPLQQSIGSSEGRLSGLEQQAESLRASTEKLFELYGRDENGWKLAEVDYLMSIAQHKLILEHDFEGAAKTLEASSGLIGELADPGLLSVRVQINDEIAELKTRKRPDLVGMTLLLSRLSQQIGHLKPGYQSNEAETARPASAPKVSIGDDQQPLDQRVITFVKSLVNVNWKTPKAERPAAAIIDVGSQLEDNLKLARWSLLDRDAHQFNSLIQQSVELFKQYYDLENAANADFYGSLTELSKAAIKPELPDISVSLRMLRKIVKQREAESGADMQEEVVSND